MQNNIFIIFGIVLITAACGSDNSQSKADSTTVLNPKIKSLIGNANNERYVCGFTGSFPHLENTPVAARLNSNDDSAIELIFTTIWSDVIGGRLDAIKIEKDADQNNSEYRYAAAKGTFSDLGNIVRHVYYKSSDLSPLLHGDNVWCVRAIALHEFAHHINGDPFTGISRDIAELGADDYAGFKLGGGSLSTTLENAILAFSTLTEEYPTNGYPDRRKRIAAVKAGWERGKLSRGNSIASALIDVKGTREGLLFNDNALDFMKIENAIKKNGTLKNLSDTSTTEMVEVIIGASKSPGAFFLDSNYMYFKTEDSISIVGRVAHSNRPGFRQMIYDNFYDYMYIDKNNFLVTFSENLEDEKIDLQPVIIGYISIRKHL